ncbi:uncharacterized protein F5891DRAFT_1275383 [Suillus fuscotomentosus]|uniref:DUF6533 domain-containing protein n=1 Tax=Suillus fuscotomentosus TaxID=1912939 RepID=A0AAD4EEZ3_9AGAM|nr:uncharacterized protein F5891DRAFT_1275383 [Suillus fuscotomentosus]KAG1905018.1 hypothetical protein F5891DRAFT_1275383 [Suillus fuscotomentosus]
MTVVSNDPTWWSSINAYSLSSYFVVAAFAAVMYDWSLTFGQEVELIWRQRWSLMTVMYLSARYLGMLYAALAILVCVPTISLTDTVSYIMFTIWNWIGVVVFALLWVIIITRLHAMYQGSRKVLIFLVVTFLAINTFDVVASIITTMHTSGEEHILSGTYQCQTSNYTGDLILITSIAWILGTVWEVIALCLAVWIVVKHFRELRQHSTGGIMEDCFTVLMKTHVLYFASFVAVSCFEMIVNFSPTLSMAISLDAQIIYGFLQISQVVQMFVLGPRLILGIREYHAKLVADSDVATGMTSIAFQERVHISTGSGV